jgi:hypothetical protein
MRRTLAVSVAAAALFVLGGTGVALAQSPTCGSAMQSLVIAQQRGVATQAEVDRLTARQTELDKVLATAQAALTAAGPAPSPITPAYQLLVNAVTTATTNVGVSRAELDAAIAADVTADNATLAAQAARDRACSPGTVTVTPTPPAPVIVRIPTAINTGRA